jgi:diguanylate cyclase (GGDEF)-like protein
LENPPSPKNTQRALILPLQIEEDVKVVFLLFYEKDTLSQSLSQETLEQRTLFIGRQIELSMKNALELSRARQQAFLDDLTGLYNARYLSVILKRELKRSQRFNHSLSVLFIDLDYFKLVNDEHGHLVGSRLLVEIAQVIKGCLREIDSAIRYGGDEYTIILVNTDSKGAHKVGERIRKAIEKYELILNDGTKVKTAACIGTASYPEHAQGVQDLLDMADQAMYRGKKTTRNVVYTFNSSISNSEKRS